MSHRPPAFEPDLTPPPEQQLQVVVHAGPLAGKGFPISGDKMTFGRDPDSDISWDDSQVSRYHAQLVRQGDQLILEDLESTNGTLVNGKPIIEPHILQPVDIISIGSSVFGVKRFAAPHTVSMTQLPPESLSYPPPVSAPTPPRPSPAPTMVSHQPVPPVQPAGTKLSMLAIGGGLALIVVILSLAAITAYVLLQRQDTTAQIPSVVITSPVDGGEVPLNLPVTVQTTASDPSGVTRMELWVNGVKTAEAASPAAQGQPTLTASLQWVPVTPGNYRLEIKAYNAQNSVSNPTFISITTIGRLPTLTPTFTPETPTATVLAIPSLTARTDLNVRAGPGTNYDLVGLLPPGVTAEIIGRDESRQWWQIRFDPAPGGIGWVSADPAFSTTSNVANVPVAQIPATSTSTSTPTSTPTPVPPTQTPTRTPIPPTETPTETPTITSTPTATEESEQIEFTVSPTVIQSGDCVAVSWNVSGVKAVYYQGEGVPGVGDREECPQETSVYNIRVIKRDDSEYLEDLSVEVINPFTSKGTIIINPGETIDFDEGKISGDDFKWTVDDATRKFESLEGVQLAPKGELGSLDELSLGECDDATYEVYAFIDGSDVVLDPVNALTNGRTACYRTSQGRLGKLRFPEYSTGSLKIEWLTWK
jgi:uncharacterized protein YraI